jgi:hypothetical protein
LDSQARPTPNEQWTPIADETTFVSDITIMNQMDIPDRLYPRQPRENDSNYQGPRRDLMAESIAEAGFSYDC